MQTIPPISTILEKVSDQSITSLGEFDNKRLMSDLKSKSDGSEYTKNDSNKKRTLFTENEDHQLEKLVEKFGTNWSMISLHMKGRTSRQCRDRWNNYLCPEINQDPWSKEEECLLFQKYNELGPQWKLMTQFFYHRSYNSIRNKFISLSRKMTNQ